MSTPAPDYVAVLVWQLRAVKNTEAAVREHRFHGERGWRLDLAFPEKRVAVEVNGGAWVGGRHVTGSGFEKDAEKMSSAASLGWRVLPVTPRMVRDGEALTLLLAALDWTAP